MNLLASATHLYEWYDDFDGAPVSIPTKLGPVLTIDCVVNSHLGLD